MGCAVALTAAAGIGTASASTYYHPHPAITDPGRERQGLPGAHVAQADVLSGDITTNGTTASATDRLLRERE